MWRNTTGRMPESLASHGCFWHFASQLLTFPSMTSRLGKRVNNPHPLSISWHGQGPGFAFRRKKVTSWWIRNPGHRNPFPSSGLGTLPSYHSLKQKQEPTFSSMSSILVGVVFVWGHFQWCSELTPGWALRIYSWQYSEGPYGIKARSYSCKATIRTTVLSLRPL